MQKIIIFYCVWFTNTGNVKGNVNHIINPVFTMSFLVVYCTFWCLMHTKNSILCTVGTVQGDFRYIAIQNSPYCRSMLSQTGFGHSHCVFIFAPDGAIVSKKNGSAYFFQLADVQKIILKEYFHMLKYILEISIFKS